MTNQVKAEEAEKANHKWVGAATVTLPSSIVRGAFRRGSIRVRRDQKVSIDEVYCTECRQSFERASEQPCLAATKAGKTVLKGGAQERKRRVPVGEVAPALAVSG